MFNGYTLLHISYINKLSPRLAKVYFRFKNISVIKTEIILYGYAWNHSFKTLYSHSAFLSQVYKCEFNANLMLGVTLRWTGIPLRGSRYTPSCFMLQ